MGRYGLLIAGLALIVAGALGLAFVASEAWLGIPLSDSQVRLSGTDTDLGARIYLDGIGEDVVVPRTAVGPGMMGGGCVTCHGIDGRGGEFSMMMGAFQAPDITYEALTGAHEDEGHAEEEAWDDDDIRRAVEEGVKPDGDALDPLMPRWDFSDREFEALLDYLKELSER